MCIRDSLNTKVGEIAGEVGMTPAAWNSGIFNMIRSLSETVIVPIASIVLTFVMCYELIQLIVEKNNLHDFDTWIFFKWIFKTFCAVLIAVSYTHLDVYKRQAEGKGRGYERWAKIHNLKQAAKTLSVYQQYGFTSPEQLEAAVDTAYQKMRQTSGELKALATKLQGKKKLQRQVLAYAQTKACLLYTSRCV